MGGGGAANTVLYLSGYIRSTPLALGQQEKVNIHDEAMAAQLTEQQLAVLRDGGTEPPYSGEFVTHSDEGVYSCAACGTELFTSAAKYESDQVQLQGWPSFAQLSHNDAVKLTDDKSHGMQRVEVACASCGGHLGHVFPDSSSPTGEHYCINSVCLSFKPALNN